MKYIKLTQDIVQGSTVVRRGSVVAFEDEMAADMLKYRKGELDTGPTRLVPEAEAEAYDRAEALIRARIVARAKARAEAEAKLAAEIEAEAEAEVAAEFKIKPTERADLGAKLAKAERGTAPPQRAGAF